MVYLRGGDGRILDIDSPLGVEDADGVTEPILKKHIDRWTIQPEGKMKDEEFYYKSLREVDRQLGILYAQAYCKGSDKVPRRDVEGVMTWINRIISSWKGSPEDIWDLM